MQPTVDLYAALARPEPFFRGETNFWDEPHISEQILMAHLDPDVESASRRPEFIDASAAWIAAVAPPDRHGALLDIGCGPGLYAERLCDSGYLVTGIDFSRRSIAYAAQRVKETGRAIEYRLGNYLAMDFRAAFDAAILIYCDFGALSPEEGARLLALIHRALRPGGKLVLDVFTPAKVAKFAERRTWEQYPDGGFWRPDAHCAIQGNYIYDDATTLEQTVVVAPGSVRPYYVWNRYFTPEGLAGELEHAGFHSLERFDTVAGKPWSGDAETLAMTAEK